LIFNIVALVLIVGIFFYGRKKWFILVNVV
jgi:hypothetical protein